MTRARDIFSRLLPWLVAIVILYILFQRYPFRDVWAATQYVRLPLFLALTTGYFLVQYLVDCHTTAKTIQRFGHRITTGDILPARGVTYLIMILNYPASQAGFAYYLKRKHGIPTFEMLGIFLFIMVIDLYWIIGMAFVGSFFQEREIGGVDLGQFVQFFTAAAVAAAALHLAFWRGWLKPVGLAPEKKAFWWMTRRPLFRIFREARLADYLTLALRRSPIHIFIILSMHFLILTFDAHVDFVHILCNIPIAFLIGTIPITPGGLGTTNAAMVALLHPYVTSPLIANQTVTAETLILAASLLWMAGNYTLKMLAGIIWLLRIPQKLIRTCQAR